MKVLILSKALVLANYQRKLELIAQELDIDLVAVVPPYWREPRTGKVFLERAYSRGYRLLVRPIALNGSFHLHFWPSLRRLLKAERPDILHIDEESFNLATFQAMWLGVRQGSRCLFFNWANIYKRLPPPFSWFERYNLSHAAHAVAGNLEAAEILRRKGYRGPLAIIPQFGVDAETFCPEQSAVGEQDRPFGTVGFAGRLVPQKGVMDLLEAVAGLPREVHLLIVGRGPLEPKLRQRAAQADLRGRVEFTGWVPSAQITNLYRRMDVLVVPSRTWPNWKEQFGRVLIEAMACTVPVVGSDSGEIPCVIGEAGLVFPEGDIAALRKRLMELIEDANLRRELGRLGRTRVLERYTQAHIAQSYAAVYRQMIATGNT